MLKKTTTLKSQTFGLRQNRVERTTEKSETQLPNQNGERKEMRKGTKKEKELEKTSDRISVLVQRFFAQQDDL